LRKCDPRPVLARLGPRARARVAVAAGLLCLGIAIGVWAAFSSTPANGSADPGPPPWPPGFVGEARCYRGHAGPVNAVALSPDGRWGSLALGHRGAAAAGPVRGPAAPPPRGGVRRRPGVDRPRRPAADGRRRAADRLGCGSGTGGGGPRTGRDHRGVRTGRPST